VGTEKRERQKAGRQSRRAEAEAVARKTRTRGAFVKWGVFAAVVLAIVVGFAVFGGDDGDDGQTTETADSTTTLVPSTTAAPTPCPPAEGVTAPQQEFDAPFEMCIDPSKSYTAVLTFNKGELRVALDAARAPTTVNNFVALARSKYFDGTDCHRIIPDFVAQCGDPTGTGRGGPGYRFEDELENQPPYQVGSLAMANSGADTNGSQFFVITGERGAALDPDYTLFGQAEPGQDDVIAALDAAGNPDPAANGVPPAEEVTLESVRIVES
jgi:cyclophilin family peptidyl-prolyl cis-trans isomerase